MANVDIHIKGGTVVDGARTPRYKADVWIKDGKILQIGGDIARRGEADDRRHRLDCRTGLC